MWHELKSKTPKENGYYLVLLDKSSGLMLGFGPNLPIVTATYKISDNEWEIGGWPRPIQNLSKMIIA